MAVRSNKLWLITVIVSVILSSVLNFLHSRYIAGHLTLASTKSLDKFVTRTRPLSGIRGGNESRANNNNVTTSETNADVQEKGE